jgi:hypothetical protein
MTEDRFMVVSAVLDGKIDASHVTLEEMKEVFAMLFEVIADKATNFEAHDTVQ